MFPTWFMVATGANGLSGGLAALWDPNWIDAKAFKCCAGIMLSATVRGHAQCLNLLNVYAPYKNRTPFWDNFFASGILDMDSLLIAGDLNVTLSPNECWGNCRDRDPLSEKIRMGLLSRNLVDVCPVQLKPTWDNGRLGPAFIAKRINRFLIKVLMIEKWRMPYSSIANEYTSDHKPIILGWESFNFRKEYYFKFSRIFLEDESFIEIINKEWQEMMGSTSTLFLSFREKIQRLKPVAKIWQTHRIKQDKEELNHIRKELNDISSASLNDMSLEKKNIIRSLEKKKHSLLYKEEARWRLKAEPYGSRQGTVTQNTFIIMLTPGEEGIQSGRSRTGMGTFSFHRRTFPTRRYSFSRLVTEDELLAAMKASKNDRSSGPDGWPIEFFLHFFDLFKADLLEASRKSGNIHSALSSTLIALIPKKGDSASFLNYRPISLCNSLFKIISKIIVERLKPVFNCFITRDQHTFLKERNIWDVVALTQECLYNI
eukprot:PITA_24864